MNRTLYVGLDDSNHGWDVGGSPYIKGEVIVAVFSFLQEDSLVVPHANRKDPFGARVLLASPERDYFFTLLTLEKYRHTPSNLPLAAQYLIREYLTRLRAEEQEVTEEERRFPENLKVYFDGRLTAGQKREVRGDFPDFPKMVVDNFIKKRNNGRGRCSKRHLCPRVVYIADTLASDILKSASLESVLSDSRFVVVP